MRGIIQRHNRLNGLVFSVVEFAFIALLCGWFATYYLVHHRPAMSLVAWGITLNSVVVGFYGVWQLAYDRTHGKPIGSFLDRASREQHRRDNPYMLRDTLTLTVAAVLPFALTLAVIFDLPR